MKAIAIVLAAMIAGALPAFADATEDLFKAVEKGTASEAKAALEAGADPNARDEGGYMPLHVAALFDNLDAVKLLLEAGADPNAGNEGDSTALRFAARNNNLEAVKLLLEAGADPGARDRYGKTPFDLAKEKGMLQGTEAYWLLHDGQYE